jgi:hypothetical protein
MEFTVELRYESGSSTVLSVDAASADEALEDVRDQRRVLVGIHITGPRQDEREAPVDRSARATTTHRRIPVQHRASRRHR